MASLAQSEGSEEVKVPLFELFDAEQTDLPDWRCCRQESVSQQIPE
jgi:hypothetical protein